MRRPPSARAFATVSCCSSTVALVRSKCIWFGSDFWSSVKTNRSRNPFSSGGSSVTSSSGSSLTSQPRTPDQKRARPTGSFASKQSATRLEAIRVRTPIWGTPTRRGTRHARSPPTAEQRDFPRSGGRRLPHLAGHLVLDLTELGSRHRVVVPRGVAAHVPQAERPHHRSRTSVHGHGLGDDPALTDDVEGLTEQGTGRLAGQALPPVPPEDPVAEVRHRRVVGLVRAVRGRKHHQPDELAPVLVARWVRPEYVDARP